MVPEQSVHLTGGRGARPRILPRTAAALAVCSLTLSACVTPTAGPNGLYAQPIGDAPVTANPTPYSTALVCLSEYARRSGARAPLRRAYSLRQTRAVE